MQNVQCYVPEPEDETDVYLGEYINSKFNRIELKNLFERENIGIYTFGTKKCFMKVENEILMVRVGGGYMTIDEFVDQYLPLEVSKVKNSYPRGLYQDEVVRRLRERDEQTPSPPRTRSNSPYARKQTQQQVRSSYNGGRWAR